MALKGFCKSNFHSGLIGLTFPCRVRSGLTRALRSVQTSALLSGTPPKICMSCRTKSSTVQTLDCLCQQMTT